MADGPNTNIWPPTEVAGTTTPRQRFAGGWGTPKESGGGTATGERIQPEYTPDLSPDFAENYMVIRWQNNRSLVWSKEHPISLNHLEGSPLTVRLRSLGIYRSRQWEIIAQAAVPLVIVAVEEEADILGS